MKNGITVLVCVCLREKEYAFDGDVRTWFGTMPCIILNCSGVCCCGVSRQVHKFSLLLKPLPIFFRQFLLCVIAMSASEKQTLLPAMGDAPGKVYTRATLK